MQVLFCYHEFFVCLNKVLTLFTRTLRPRLVLETTYKINKCNFSNIKKFFSSTPLHGLSLLRTLNDGPDGVRNKGSGLYIPLPPYVLQAENPRFVDQSSRLMVWRYKLFKAPYFSARSSRTTATGAILTGSNLKYLGGGGRFGNPEARPLGTFETNYKMAGSEGERPMSTILRKCRDLMLRPVTTHLGFRSYLLIPPRTNIAIMMRENIYY